MERTSRLILVLYLIGAVLSEDQYPEIDSPVRSPLNIPQHAGTADDEPQIIETVGSDQECPTPTPDILPCDGTGPTCIRSCPSNGDHQSCRDCHEYVSCVWSQMIYMPCPSGLVWDDSVKQCRYTSPTCLSCDVQTEPKWIEFDFPAGSTGRETSALSWIVKPPAQADNECLSTGLLKIAPPSTCNKEVTFQLTLKRYKYFNFHIAGTQFNDGYADLIFGSVFGTYDAELHNFQDIINAFTSSGSGLLPWNKAMPPINGEITLCLKIRENEVDMMLGDQNIRIAAPGLFSRVNPLYIGINRVISQNHQEVLGGVGDGLCSGRISFEC